MRPWIDVATLVKTRNLKGRFVARSAAGLPFVLEEGMHVAFVPPQLDVPREGVVSYVGELDGASWEVEFDTVSDESVAHELVGCHCLVRRADVPDVSPNEEPALLLGWEMRDATGAVIGTVIDMVENPAHPLLEVERPDGPGNASVPVVDEFIVEIDEDARVITVDLPDGLLDL